MMTKKKKKNSPELLKEIPSDFASNCRLDSDKSIWDTLINLVVKLETSLKVCLKLVFLLFLTTIKFRERYVE